jgi:hypothetical protein
MIKSLTRRHTWIVAAACLALAAGSARADVAESHKFEARELEVHNLIGEITVEGHAGRAFEVDVRIQGRDASKERVRVEAEQGEPAVLKVVFPSAGSFIYPRLGHGSTTRITQGGEQGGWLVQLLGALGRRGITVRGSGSGLELWADVTVRVPAGGALKVRHGVGQVHAAEVKGRLDLATRSGAVEAAGVDGELRVDTGSGHVELREVQGRVAVDTGSGHVSGDELEGREIEIDTGSGHVELDGVRASTLHVDTGSGHVSARNVAAESAEIDTGSGGVDLELREMGRGEFRVDTGSGGITLLVPAEASAEISASTGSGGIALDFDDAERIRRRERNEVEFSLGDGAARVVLETGSGPIRIGRSSGRRLL